ncbi:metallophosphatase family protein [Desulfonema ishimotonii]|uniref:Metallophosphatase family protein n=1 Tax=Desulfonema ishimotonii TaxID=45657 RepID=A0A401FRN5_9BACT|nr:metallophosphoesterase family protein [Desulfonema ishimotonii]GBC59621.1 metallophosphatase family protein [Desulfonema ishimotonii]
MRIAVLADIHGNLEAFQAVLADIDRADIDDILSLGDNIGYGPDSEPVMALLRDRRIPSVLGNHELVIKKPGFYKWFNPTVRETLQKTAAALSAENIQAICDMEPFLVRHGCRFVHGFPPKSPLLYLFQASEKKQRRVFSRIGERLCFIGHTHDLGLVAFDGDHLRYLPLPEGITRLDADRRYIVNIGSVGQPRDGDNRAKYVIRDTAEDTLETRFIPYDIESVVKKILAAGYPGYFARRLR